MIKNKILNLIYICLLMILSRIVKHPPNFTPVISLAIMLPIFFSEFRFSILVFLISLSISDLFLGFYNGVIFNYLVYFSIFLLSSFLLKKNILKRLILLTFVCPIIFFVFSNFYVWLFSNLYTVNLDGLITCFVFAIPFFQQTLLSTIFFNFLSLIFFFIRDKKNKLTA